jgi:hypothetical protein
MSNYNLSFISDIDLFNHVQETVQKYRFSIDLKNFNKNIVDPIKATFDSKIYNKPICDIIESEVLRQLDKSNNNHIGYFHQNIFKYLGNGWHVPSKGFDVVNDLQKIYIEMKNKHNTMNSSSSQKTYMRMQSVLIKEPSAICMLVEIIAMKSQNIEWIIRLDGDKVSNKNIRLVSIDQFYALVTGEEEAFKQLCEKLPAVIQDVVSLKISTNNTNTVFAELEQISPNILENLYLLAFKKYQGFNKFDL